MESARNQTFRRLKPCCVDLSQVALSFGVHKATGKDVLRSLEALEKALQDECGRHTLDQKLADYAFFPLSHILKQSQRIPVRALELTLHCIRILLEEGWRDKLAINLGQQLQILLCFLASGKSTGPETTRHGELSEELKIEAFNCLSALFRCFCQSAEGRAALVETATLPALGHTVTVLLDGITEGASNEVQLSATAALESLQSCIAEREILANFLPGIVSALTKALQPSTKSKRSYKVLKGCIERLSDILQAVVDDTAFDFATKSSSALTTKTSTKDPQLGPSWLKATAAQIKLALANVIKLRNHDRVQVRLALLRLSLVVLESCRTSLADSAPMMVETLIVLSTATESDDSVASLRALDRVASSDPTIADILKSSLRDWVVALPRVMQGNDELPKKRLIAQITKSLELLDKLGTDLSIVDRDLGVNLRDSVAAAIHLSPKQLTIKEQAQVSTTSLEVLSVGGKAVTKVFPPVLLSQRGQYETLLALKSLGTQLKASGSSLVLARDMLEQIRSTEGDGQLASFWLSLSVLGSASPESLEFKDLVDYGRSRDSRAVLLEELYSFSLSILTDASSEEDLDWRLQCLAIEAVAEHAQQLKAEFRIELIDALYPLVHLIGSTHAHVRDHALVCLNIVSKTCQYSNVSDLIISNVDYLVNAVALKLNTFDISPQAPGVLLMMIRLTGPALLPYLDDLVGSVFAALDCFHGYPRLVELLFSVLGGIVDEGAKAPMRAITCESEVNHRKAAFKPRNIADVVDRLAALKSKASEPIDDDHEPETFPQKPWKTFNEELSQNTTTTSSQDLSKPSETPPPLTKTHTMLLSITRLTQHYLTHSSPHLRSQLLALTSRSTSLLATHEDSFLPLVNDIWPVVVKRLYDPEPFVCIAACEAISQLCVGAGDFLTTRLETEWESIRALYKDIFKAVKREKKGQGGRGTFSTHYRIWDALVRLFVVLLRHVRVEEDVVDDVLRLVGEVLESRRDVREALEEVNPDAVWLELLSRRKRRRKGEVWSGSVPVLEGWVFKEVVV